MTIKLYDQDSHMNQFTATVLSCVPVGKRYQVILDQTAFFPEGGGQLADTGMLGSGKVLDVQETPDGIVHVTDRPLKEGETVTGVLFWKQRFARMQNHSGEHVLSGLVYQRYGYRNVGFHMGERGMLLDFDGELNADQLAETERMANEIVWQNRPITGEYPNPEALAEMEYRSKLEYMEQTRIVTIQGVDRCACCAPHVSRTGEIGLIKILDFMRHRGGVRVRVICGRDALADYSRKHQEISALSALFSAKPEKIAQSAAGVQDQLQETKRHLAELQRELIRQKLKAIEPTKGNLLLFEPVLDLEGLRALVNGAVEKTDGICAAFTGSEKAGFRYVMGSRQVNLQEKAGEINRAVCGKGGGSPEMIQGTARCTRQALTAYFKEGTKA
jgi:alanyl-tRNA synthetase